MDLRALDEVLAPLRSGPLPKRSLRDIRRRMGKIRGQRSHTQLHHIHKALQSALGPLNIDRTSPSGAQALATLSNHMAKQPPEHGGGEHWYKAKSAAVAHAISQGAEYGQRPTRGGNIIYTKTKEGGLHSYHDRGDISQALGRRGIKEIPTWTRTRAGKGNPALQILQRAREGAPEPSVRERMKPILNPSSRPTS